MCKYILCDLQYKLYEHILYKNVTLNFMRQKTISFGHRLHVSEVLSFYFLKVVCSENFTVIVITQSASANHGLFR
jgi:hypothetical protein